MPVVTFIKLNVNNKSRTICDLVEKCFMAGEQIVVQVADQAQALELDKLLWTWKQNSFIPHRVVQAAENDSAEAVLITDNLSHLPQGHRLILADAPADVSVDGYAEVIDFAEIYDLARLETSRIRYKHYRATGYELRDMLLGEFLA